MIRPLSLTCLRTVSKVHFTNFSTVPKGSRLVNVTKNTDNGVAVLSLLKPPVNTLDLNMLTSLQSAVKKLRAEGSQGIILTSECPIVFSAGLDLKEFYNVDLDRLRLFWKALQDTWYELYTFPNPMAAAINGHSPAAGCMLALTCDYRAMVGRKFTIGLNEAKVGIPSPFWLQDTFKNVIGCRRAEQALLSGKLFTTNQAYEIGLVDEVALDSDEAVAKAEDFIEAQLSLPDLARCTTKIQFRERTIEKFTRLRDEELDFMVDYLQKPEIQTSVENYMASLRK